MCNQLWFQFFIWIIVIAHFKKICNFSLEKAVLATFWASSLGWARILHQQQNPVYLDFSNHLGYQLTENKRENLPLSE